MTTDQPLNIKAFFNLFLIEEGAHSQCHKRTRTNKNKTQNPTNKPQFQVIWKTFAQTTRTGAQRNPEGGIHVENIKIHKVRTSGSQSSHLRPKQTQQNQSNSNKPQQFQKHRCPTLLVNIGESGSLSNVSVRSSLASWRIRRFTHE